MKVHHINSDKISLSTIEKIIKENYKLELSKEAKEKVLIARNYLDDKLDSTDDIIYGINTGFGALCNTLISKDKLEELQENLVISHACGQGDEVPSHIVKTMMLLKIQGLSYGHSAIGLKTLQLLVDLFNNDVIPVVFEQGSLGASGDLAPLAHLSLPLIGRGEVYYQGKRRESQEVLTQLGLQKVRLFSKEGLALLNGTQFMQAFGSWILIDAQKYFDVANLIATISLEGFNGNKEAFYPSIHQIRGHQGQIDTAKAILNNLEGSEIINATKTDVQDPYTFRCTPQVHGASKDVIDYATKVFETEINSVTDNPTVFPEEDLIISGGNFHGQPLSMALDSLCLAIAEIGGISERRTYKLISGQRDLPPFLIKKSGLNSGFMISQYTAASIVSQNKQLCTPAVIDSIDSSNGQEDHVSMGANAATKCYRVTKNVLSILAIEIFTAFQALEFRRPLKSSSKIEDVFTKYRKIVPFVEDDVEMYRFINSTKEFIRREFLNEI